MKARPIAVSVLLGLVVGGCCTDPAVKLVRAVIAGEESIAAKEFAKARQHFAEAAKAAERKDDAEARTEAAFYRGLSAQTALSDDTASEKLKGQLRSVAIREYEAVLDAKSDSAGTMNNLARLYASDSPARAEQLFKAAIAAETPDRTQFELNYADFLHDHNRTTEALEVVKRVAEVRGGDEAVQERVVRFGTALGEGTILVPTLRERLAAGGVAEVTSSALTALRDPETVSATAPLLLVLVDALRQSPHDPQAFVRQASEAPAPEGLTELVSLHREAGEPDDYQWWQADTSSMRGASGPRSTAFRSMARHLGNGYVGMGDLKLAERYFRLAADFDPESSDPEAVLSLAEIYFARNDAEAAKALVQQYEQPLFRGKAGMIARGDDAGQYRFHRALGLIYARLRNWGDAEESASAIFQLEAMRDDARRHNASLGEGESPLPFEPRVAALLAAGYAEIGDSDRALLARADAAETYLAQNDAAGAAEIVAPVSSAQVMTVLAENPEVTRRFAQVAARIPANAEGRNGEKPPFTNAELAWVRDASMFVSRAVAPPTLAWLEPLPPPALEEPEDDEPMPLLLAALDRYVSGMRNGTATIADAALADAVRLAARAPESERELIVREISDLDHTHRRGDTTQALMMAERTRARLLGATQPSPPPSRSHVPRRRKQASEPKTEQGTSTGQQATTTGGQTNTIGGSSAAPASAAVVTPPPVTKRPVKVEVEKRQRERPSEEGFPWRYVLTVLGLIAGGLISTRIRPKPPVAP